MQLPGPRRHLKSHAERIYSNVIRGDVFAARELAKKILSREVSNGFALRDIYRRGWTGLGTAEDAKAAADYLVDLDWLWEVKNPTAGRTGTVYLINPKLWEQGGPKSGLSPSGAPDKGDGSGDGAAPKSAIPPSGGGDRADRSARDDPSGGSVSGSGGGSPEIRHNQRDDQPPAADDNGERTWTG